MILIPYIVDTNKQYKLSGLDKLRYTNKSMCLLVNPVCLLVYRCSSHYCIFYHDRPLSWY